MTKEDFISKLESKGYKINPQYTDLDVWEQSGNNILIHVKKNSFDRIIRFDNGNLGHAESLKFDKHHIL